jgi:hypothetical protein
MHNGVLALRSLTFALVPGEIARPFLPITPGRRREQSGFWPISTIPKRRNCLAVDPAPSQFIKIPPL